MSKLQCSRSMLSFDFMLNIVDYSETIYITNRMIWFQVFELFPDFLYLLIYHFCVLPELCWKSRLGRVGELNVSDVLALFSLC